MLLDLFFQQHPRIALAFSGGVDSAYLLSAAVRFGCTIHAFFVKSPFQPQFELDDARRLAAELAVPLHVLQLDPLADPNIAANGPLRCYYCKHAIFSRLLEEAQHWDLPLLIDGTNASDQVDDRPGMRALSELGIRSPLRECGLTKADIRRLSHEAGLFTHDKPAYACLATRVPTGVPITLELLERVECGEAALMRLGFSDMRLRMLGDAARLELPVHQMPRAIELRSELLHTLEPWFSAVYLDLAGRKTEG